MAVGLELLKHLGACHKAALTVADSNSVDIANIGLGQPRRVVRRNTGANKTTLVAADGVERQGRTLGGHRNDVAIRNETEFDESLKAVANAKHEAVALLEQLANSLGDGGIAEERGDELRGTIWLVAAGETSGNHDDVGGIDLFDKFCRALSNRGGRQIVDDEGMSLCASSLKRTGGIELAVVAREDRDDDARLRLKQNRGLDLGGLGRKADGLDLFARSAIGEDALDTGLPCLLELGHTNAFSLDGKRISLGRLADNSNGNVVGCGSLSATGKLDDKGTISRRKQVDIGIERNADAVTDAHLEQGLCESTITGSRNSLGLTATDEILDHRDGGVEACGLRDETLLVIGGLDVEDSIANLLELGTRDAIKRTDGCRKAHERRGDVKIIKTSRHGVLAADCSDAEVNLGHQSTEQATGWHAPTLGDIAQLAEILLECEVHVLLGETRGGKATNALDNGVVGASVLVRGRQVGVEAPRHAADRGRLAVNGELGNHGHARGQLLAATERHEDRCGADGGVEALREALVRCDVEVGNEGGHSLFERTGGLGRRCTIRLGGENVDTRSLRSTIAVEERTADADDRIASPPHDQTRILGDRRDDRCLKILLARITEEFLDILGGDGARHTLLGLSNCQLGAIKAFVLFGNKVEVDVETVRDLTRGDRDATCAEIVATLDQLAGIAAAEQALELTLDRSIALLNLGATRLDGSRGVGLGGTGCTADAVTSRAAAEQDDGISRSWGLATNVPGGSCGDNGADLHALGGIPGVI